VFWIALKQSNQKLGLIERLSFPVKKLTAFECRLNEVANSDDKKFTGLRKSNPVLFATSYC